MIIHSIKDRGRSDKGIGRAFAKQREIFQNIEFNEEVLAGLRVEFNAYDTDHSGTIDPEELETALKTLQVWEGPEQLKKIFAELDIDGNGSIEFYEFCMMINSMRKQGTKLDFATVHEKQKAQLARQKDPRFRKGMFDCCFGRNQVYEVEVEKTPQ